MPEETLRCVWEVTAGIIPGQVMRDHTRRFPLTSRQWDGGSEAGVDAYNEAATEAMIYARGLMSPAHLNWVRVDWVWM